MKLSKDDLYTCAVLEGFLRMIDDNNKSIKGVAIMATNPRTSIAEQFRKTDLAISNAMNDEEISKSLESFGYDRAKFERGRALLDFAKAAVNAKVSAEGALREATAALKTAEIAAREAFQALAQVAKAGFGRETLASLGLSSAMPHACAAFLTAGYALFDNAQKIPGVQAKLASYGYDAQKLSREREKISAYARADHAQEAAKGAAQQATDTQNRALNQLKYWIAEYLKIAKLALRDKKQLLEKLGVAVRTSPGLAVHQAPQPQKGTEPPVTPAPIVTGPQNTKT